MNEVTFIELNEWKTVNYTLHECIINKTCPKCTIFYLTFQDVLVGLAETYPSISKNEAK